MRVSELLARKSGTFITVEATEEVATVSRLLIRHTIGGVPVVTSTGRLVGFVAERDIVRAVDAHGDGAAHVTAERVMQPPPTCRADASLREIMSRMTRERLRHLVVIDGTNPIGVVSVGDLVKHRLEELEVEAGTLRDYVAAQRAAR